MKLNYYCTINAPVFSGISSSRSDHFRYTPQTLHHDPSKSNSLQRLVFTPAKKLTTVQNTPAVQEPPINTPTSHFRPRKFSSPFVTFPPFNLDGVVTDATDDARPSLADSGFGSSLADHVIYRNKLCPK